MELKNNENSKRNSVGTQQFVLLFIYKLLGVSSLDFTLQENLIEIKHLLVLRFPGQKDFAIDYLRFISCP